MNRIYSNPEKNRLYLTLVSLNDSDIKNLVRDLTKTVGMLQEGFTCLVDIRSMKVEHEGRISHYAEVIQGALLDVGMRKLVRVVNKDNMLAQTLLDRASRSAGYHGRPVATLEEGEKMLDKSIFNP